MNQAIDIPLLTARPTGQEQAPALPNIYDLRPEELLAAMGEWGQPVYRAKQVLQWLYKDLVTEFSEMTNLPLDLRRKLEASYRIGSAQVVTQQMSAGGDTRKVLFRFADGNTVETVLMLYYDRATVCVSSQVGCAMGCVFCATGQMGFTRNLTPGEIVEQTLVFSRWLREHPYTPPTPRRQQPSRPQTLPARGGQRPGIRPNAQQFRAPAPVAPAPLNAVTNIVFMGMGEPFINYDNLLQAIKTLNSPDGLALGARRMTVSTVGLVPRIRRFAREELAVNLAISLHAPNDEHRNKLIPLNQKYPLAELMDACKEYIELTGRRLSFEYALIAGSNDSLDYARQMAKLLKGIGPVHVNLIPLNPVPGTGLAATPREQVRAFAETLEKAGIPCTVRIERGQDIAAACGQLKVEHEPNSKHRSINPNFDGPEHGEAITLNIPAHEIQP